MATEIIGIVGLSLVFLVAALFASHGHWGNLGSSGVVGDAGKYYDLGEGWCTYDFFAKCPHRPACARCPFYLPKQSSAGQLLAVKDGIQQLLEQLDLTGDERVALEGDREAVAALAERLADIPTPAGPTPKQLGTTTAFIPLTALRDSRPGGVGHDGHQHLAMRPRTRPGRAPQRQHGQRACPGHRNRS